MPWQSSLKYVMHFILHTVKVSFTAISTPENILLDKKGRVKIADFGLAKLLGQKMEHLTLTGTNQIVGTLNYMAPEQLEKPMAVDHRADIYSLGVVFYELLTGELPIGRFSPPSEF